jgi:hypothetical protein
VAAVGAINANTTKKGQPRVLLALANLQSGIGNRAAGLANCNPPLSAINGGGIVFREALSIKSKNVLGAAPVSQNPVWSGLHFSR